MNLAFDSVSAKRTMGNPFCKRPAEFAVAIAAAALFLPLQSIAGGVGTPIYQGMTLPAGLVKVGNDYWVSDHVYGFCKLIAGASASSPGFVDQGSCNKSQVSPGQAVAKEAVDPNDPSGKVTYVYVPDNSSNGQGVWRHTIKNGYIWDSKMLPNNGIAGNRPMAVAMGPDGNLYVSLGRNNSSIMRIKNPDPTHDALPDQLSEKYGNSVVRVGPPAMAFIENTLYLAENTGLTSISGSIDVNTSALSCGSTCTAKPVNSGVGAPVFVTSDATTLYIADLGNAYRYTPGIPGCLKPVGSGYGNVASLALNPASATVAASLYVADDPTAGTSFFKGTVYSVDSNPIGDCVTAGAPGGPTGGGVGAPPSANSPVTISGPVVGASLPSGFIQIGAETWISDHLQGFCRLGPNGPEACVTTAAKAPGQAVAVASKLPNGAAVTYIYVPDTSSKGLGVWRLMHDGSGIVNATLLAPNQLTGARTTAVAYGPDKKLYVVAGKNNSVMRIDTPEGNPTKVENIGFVTGRAGPKSMTFKGRDLYLAEATAVTTIPAAENCIDGKPSLCTARTFSQPVGAPVFVTSDDTYLYIADVSKAYRFAFSTTTSQSTITELGKGFATISALGFNIQPASTTGAPIVRSLFVGDDTTAGTSLNTGRVWKLDMSGLGWP